eukprot:Amastigsp_a843696_57.p4 type:complete len:153 gc:universal Amastigsp_a843696_57:569-1027(+)
MWFSSGWMAMVTGAGAEKLPDGSTARKVNDGAGTYGQNGSVQKSTGGVKSSSKNSRRSPTAAATGTPAELNRSSDPTAGSERISTRIGVSPSGSATWRASAARTTFSPKTNAAGDAVGAWLTCVMLSVTVAGGDAVRPPSSRHVNWNASRPW